MKTSTILLVFLFAFTTKTSLFAHANTPVLDSDGDQIQVGVEYFVLSWLWGAGGGGLYLEFDPVDKCPEIVAQYGRDSQLGLPVTFSNVDGTDDGVYENSNITVTFVPIRFKFCLTSTTWQVVSDESSGKDLVTLGGVEGESATVFTLKKHGGLAYKFNHDGSDIGRYFDQKHSLIRLAVDPDIPWGWVFVKANKNKAIKQVVHV